MRNSTPVFTLICLFAGAFLMAQNPAILAPISNVNAFITVTVNTTSPIGPNTDRLDILEPSFSINPNPVHDRATLLFRTSNTAQTHYKVAIYNVLGQRVDRFVMEPNTPYLFERDKLKAGIYMIQISDENAIISGVKMVIR